MPTKPEGPAQEPQVDNLTRARDAMLWIASQEDMTFAECTLAEQIISKAWEALALLPATPAPSQPAGAREWLFDQINILRKMPAVFPTEAVPNLLDAYARQQTAAKDAALQAAERERGSLREENERLRENWKIKAQQFMDDIKRMVEVHDAENAALKAGKE